MIRPVFGIHPQPDGDGPPSRLARGERLRLLTGIVFAIAGTPKFFAHDWEADHFRAYGLPLPDAFVYLIGSIEIIGGLALIAGFAVRPVSLLLGAVMIGAIVTSGIGQGEWLPSLTLAPALLVASAYLVWTDPRHGRRSSPPPLV